MCRKVVKLTLTCLTKQSPFCQDVDAAPKSDPITFPNMIPKAPNGVSVSI